MDVFCVEETSEQKLYPIEYLTVSKEIRDSGVPLHSDLRPQRTGEGSVARYIQRTSRPGRLEWGTTYDRSAWGQECESALNTEPKAGTRHTALDTDHGSSTSSDR